MNQCSFTGNLTKDAEIRNTTSGDVCSFSIAINERGGKDKEDTTLFLDCALWGKRVAPHLAKGTGVWVVGRLRIKRSKDDEGRWDTRVGLNVDNIGFTGGGQQKKEEVKQDEMPF
jgi:single stranded DNA-binding protein